MPEYDQILSALIAHGTPDTYRPGMSPEQVRTLRWPCPVCHSSDGVALSPGDTVAAVLTCHAGGCAYEEIMEALGIETGADGCTVESLAEYLGIPEEWLDDGEWTNAAPYGSRPPRVEIPYPADPATGDPRWRYRISHNGKAKFQWPRGAKVKGHGLLYRGDDLQHASQGVVLVEGESDAETVLRGAGYCAVGLPGATMWDENTHAPQFTAVGTIFTIIEPDSGGSAMFNSLARSAVREKVRVVRLYDAEGRSVKDARAFYLLDPATFRERLDAAFAGSKTFAQCEAEINALEAKAALTDAGDIPTRPDILADLVEDAHKNGLVGESGLVAGTVLSITSALQKLRTPAGKRLPANLVIKGPSGGGKSEVENTARRYFPEDYYYFLSAASDKALIYENDPAIFRNRMIIVAEAAALEHNGQDTPFAKNTRTLLTDGFLKYPTVVTGGPGEPPVTVHIEKEGPTGLILTTTAHQIHPEHETRMHSVTIDSSPEQTRAIMDMIGLKYAGIVTETDPTQWQAFFKWLRLTQRDCEVVIPYAPQLAALVDSTKGTRLRRDISTLYSFISARAILHAATRERDDQGRIIATLDDYAAIRYYLGESFSENLDATVSDEDRKTVAAVAAVAARKEKEHSALSGVPMDTTVSYKELGEQLGLGRATARDRAMALIEDGWLANEETRRGQAAKLVVVRLPNPEEDRDLLPTVEELIKEQIRELEERSQQAPETENTP